MLTIQYQPQPQKRQHTYMDQVTDPEQGFHADSAWNFFQEACGMFPQRAHKSFCVPRSRLLSVSDHRSCVEKIPESEEQKRLCVSIEFRDGAGGRKAACHFSIFMLKEIKGSQNIPPLKCHCVGGVYMSISQSLKPMHGKS